MVEYRMKSEIIWDFERVLTAFLKLALLKGWKYEAHTDLPGNPAIETVSEAVVLDSAQVETDIK